MKHLFPHLFFKIDVSTLSCDVCIRAKQHWVSFPSQLYKPTHPFILVHSDVWGPSKVTTSSGKWWFVMFIDDHIRLTWVFLISDKSEVTSVFQDFYHTVETQFNAKIAILRSENDREFQNHTLNEFLSSKGIVHQSSCAYTPQQNGIAERKNCHLLEVARSLMLSTSLPSYLLDDAILAAAHLINMLPSPYYISVSFLMFLSGCLGAQPMFITMILIQLSLLLELRHAFLLVILCTTINAFIPSSRTYFVSMDHLS